MTEKSTSSAPTPGQKITVAPAPFSSPETVAEQKSTQPVPPKAVAVHQSPAPAAIENPVASPSAGSPTKASLYTVKSGDTLIRIAKTHGITVKALKSANNLESDRIVVGAKLRIPEA